jgi:hypothetical protein
MQTVITSAKHPDDKLSRKLSATWSADCVHEAWEVVQHRNMYSVGGFTFRTAYKHAVVSAIRSKFNISHFPMRAPGKNTAWQGKLLFRAASAGHRDLSSLLTDDWTRSVCLVKIDNAACLFVYVEHLH